MSYKDDAFRVEQLAFETITISEGSSDPSVSGFVAPNGSLFINSTNTKLYQKFDIQDTNWHPLTYLYLYEEKVDPLSVVQSAVIGTNSIALGNGATAEADSSIAIGSQSLSRIQNSIVISGGRFASQGDAQAGKYFLRTTTINGSPHEAFIDGTNGSIRLTLPDNSTWSFSAMITGHQTDTAGGHAGYEVKGVIYRDSGANTTSIQGMVIKSVFAESNPVWDINITADTTNGALVLFVTGESGKTIRWLGVIDTVEITN